MQQDKKQQHQRPGINFMLIKIQNITNSRFSKLIIVFYHVWVTKDWRKAVCVKLSASPVVSSNQFSIGGASQI